MPSLSLESAASASSVENPRLLITWGNWLSVSTRDTAESREVVTAPIAVDMALDMMLPAATPAAPTPPVNDALNDFAPLAPLADRADSTVLVKPLPILGRMET